MKKITLLGINARFTHSNLALFYLKMAIEDLPYQVSHLEESINQDKFKILAKVVKSQADILAISTYIWNRDIVTFIFTALKKISPQTIVVLGGPEAGYNTSYWQAREIKPDYIIVGSGEAAWRSLAINDFNNQEMIIQTSNYSFQEINFPYRNEDFSQLKNKYIYYEASRGCPFKCSFCLSSRLDQKLEYKNIDLIIKELKVILSNKPKIIKFVDRSFNADTKISQAIWKFINSLEIDTKFHFEIHPALLKEADFAILSKTPKDRIQFEIGVQSTNPKTISAINRNHHFQKYKDKLKKLLDIRNIHTHLDLILGLPYENKDSFLNSLNDLLELKADVIQLGFLKVLPGTELASKEEEYGLEYDSLPPYQILSTKWLPFIDMMFFYDFEDIFNHIYNSSRLRYTLAYISSQLDRPVDFFTLFTEYLQDNFEISNSNWINIFYTLRQFIFETYPQIDKDLIDDYLSWDWLLHSRKNNLPDFIDRQENHNFKHQVFQALKDKEDNSWESLLGSKVKNLNNCAFFVARSNKFKKNILNGKTKALLFSSDLVFL